MYKIENIVWNKRELIRLSGPQISACIDPCDGMTVVSVCFEGKELLYYDDQHFKSGATYGIPILYPTPNRVKNEQFLFENSLYKGVMHGCARKSKFTITARETTKTSAYVTGQVDFCKGSDAYQSFPFDSLFQLTITLTKDGLCWTYEVQNKDEKSLGYGFGIHPFFAKLQGAQFRTSAAHVMCMDSQKIPDGSTLAVSCTDMDLSNFVSTQKLALDHIFYAQDGIPTSEINYPNDNIKLQLYASNESNHVVVYTPHNQPFFCIEPQTCSSDTHNLYASGFKKQSNLQIIQPNNKKNGWVKLRIQHIIT